MKVTLTETAVGELAAILAYIAAENPDAASRVSLAVDRTIDWIGRWPRVSPVVRVPNVRAKLVLGLGLRVFYVVGDEGVVVRNIRSTRRLRPWESRT